MNKSFNITFIITLFMFTTFIFIAGSPKMATAQTATPTTVAVSPTKKPTSIPADDQIEKIKDLVASKVAELKLVDKRGLVGYVKATTSTQISITDHKSREVKIDVDELTKFESPDNDNFGISDVKKGDLLSFVGLYNKQSERLMARFVEVASSIPQNIEGVVLSKDTSEFTLNIATVDGSKKIISIETSTKTNVYQEGETVKSGFSKILPGERVIIVGFEDKTNKDQVNASRIIHFPGMKLSNELKKAAAQSTKESASPTP